MKEQHTDADSSSTKQHDPPKPLSLIALVLDPVRLNDRITTQQYQGHGTDSSPFLVAWIDDDHGNPENWSMLLKMLISAAVGLQYLVTAIGSSALSGSLDDIKQQTSSSSLLAISCIGVFVLGFALGPLLWAPLSEQWGRQPINLATASVYAVTSGACILATDNISALLVLRFLAGSFGSASVACSASVVAELFVPQQRRLAMSMFALIPALGPTLGPALGAYIGEAGGPRWLFGSLAIMAVFAWIFSAATVPETYGPRVLQLRARRLSKLTGKQFAVKHTGQTPGQGARSTLLKTVSRPWSLLLREPIVLAMSLFSGVAYGILYLFFAAYPAVFKTQRGWSSGLTGLAFLSMAVGMAAAIAVEVVLIVHGRASQDRSRPLAPEVQLMGCMIGACFIPLGIFWFSWTSPPTVHWLLPVTAGAPFGFGLMLVLLSNTNYLIHVYTVYAASAFAATNVFRYLCGAGFPLLAPTLYRNLGVQWGGSIPGFLSLACAPLPFLLYLYGPALRTRGPYCSRAQQIVAGMRANVGGRSEV